MIIFLYGEDTYRSRQKLREIIEHYKKIHESGLNLRFFAGENLNYQEFENEFKQFSMFQEKKLLILRNVFQSQEFKDSFLENGQKLIDSKDIVVFHEDGGVSPKDPLFEFLTENAKTQAFQPLDGEKLRSWVKNEFEARKTEIQPEAVYRLVNFTGNDLWQLSNEVQKLASFSKKPIELRDVNLLVRPQIGTDIFKTIEALASRNKKEAISLIHDHLEKGDNPLYLLSMISFQFRNLLIMKKTGRLAGHPYFVRKTRALADSFTLGEMEKIYRKIFEADLKIKTGQIDQQLALDLLITEI
ncbi:MAG: DNA polymerase III subunit delta [bacterium]|nr:DNA polymerase III subunit delta [bacterium]